MDIIEKLKPFMFTKQHMKELPRVFLKTPKKKELNVQEKEKVDIFIPQHSDTLFWCFYIMENDWSEYHMVGQHYFQIEKNKKISYIEKIRTMKENLKSRKFKISEIENDLLNNRRIHYKTFIALCVLYDINVIVVYDHYYYQYTEGKGDPYVIRQDRGWFGISLNSMDENVLQSYWKIENIHKPLKGISTYKVNDLKKICRKLKLDICNESGRMHNKKQLYNLIRQKIE